MVKKIVLAALVLIIAIAAVSIMKNAQKQDFEAVSGYAVYNNPQYLCTDGMVSYWQGENDANDSFGNNNGALVGGISFVDGKIGKAFSFNGNDSYVSISDNDHLDIISPEGKGNNEMTWEAWALSHQSSTTSYVFNKLNLTNITNGPFYSALGISFSISNSTDIEGNVHGPLVSVETWHHYAITFNKGNLTFYTDGIKTGNDSLSFSQIPDNSFPLIIGHSGCSTEPMPFCMFFNGTIDEIAVYSKALSQADIVRHYNEGNGRPYCLPKCSDGLKDGDETDVDCGGSCATKCANGKSCLSNSDCQNNACSFGICSSIQQGEVSVSALNLRRNYMPGASLEGTFNISLKDYAADSLITLKILGITKQMPLLDFLKANNISFKCDPGNCLSYYVINTPEQTKTVKGAGYIATIAEGENISASSLEFEMIGENTKPECGISPLTIDLLNDDVIDWKYLKSGEGFCHELKPGDYYSPDKASPTYIISTTPYCEKINLAAASKFKLAADIVAGNKDVSLMLSIGNNGFNAGAMCEITAATGMQECTVDFAAFEDKDYFVCIKAFDGLDRAYESDHLIKGERVAPNCGFSGTIGDCTDSTIDFGIYAQSSDYANFDENSIFNEANFFGPVKGAPKIASYINEYLEKAYGKTCSDKCVIPIKISSTQNINFMNLGFLYRTDTITIRNTDFYNAEKLSSLANINQSAAKIEKAGLNVPIKYGTYPIELKIGDTIIDNGNIIVEKLPVLSLYPLNVSAGISTKFTLSTENVTSYYWEFGDSTFASTKVPYVEHTYNAVKEYFLKITVTTQKNVNVSQTFKITSFAPKDYVNNTLNQKIAYLTSLQKDIDSMEDWYKTMVSEQIKVADMRQTLSSYQTEFLKPDADFVSLKNKVENFIVYKSIKSDELGSSPVSQIIDLESLKNAGAGNLPSTAESEQKLKNNIESWQSNLEIKADATVKVAESEVANNNADLFTLITIEINPLASDLGDFFFIIKGMANAKFPDNTSKQAVGDSIALTLNGNSENIIKLAAPGRVNPANIEVTSSPAFSKFEIAAYTCGNTLCETENGESYKNCPDDCPKPLTGTIIIIVFIALGAGGALYWIWKFYVHSYEKKLEEKLFKNKADLYNMTFFITKSLNKGENEENIRKKLAEAKWNPEQIDYSISKTKRERRAVQLNTLLNFISNGIRQGKPEETIKNELKEAGWIEKDINYAYKKAVKQLEDEKKRMEKAASSKKPEMQLFRPK